MQTNLVSSGRSITARYHDKHLLNPWGLAFIPGDPIWIADNLSGISTLYKPGGKKVPPTVTIPLPTGMTGKSTPDGVAANASTYQLADTILFSIPRTARSVPGARITAPQQC